MIKAVLIRTTGHAAVAAACALLAACAPYPAPVQAIPPGPTPNELADYAAAQMQYRIGLATGNGDAVAAANETFRQIPRAIFSREYPATFEAELVCERYKVPGQASTGLNVPTPFELQCESITLRYNGATAAIRQDLNRRIVAVDFATIAQAGAAHP
jgi:hypothetical protein